jgi:catechol 2,3-dioxygenase-like lactoylglutathione lyase family enzyme
MKPRITMLTLGVDDLERSVKFYRDGLGLPTEGIVGKEFEHGAVAFFDLRTGLKLAVFSRSDLAFDAGIARSDKRVLSQVGPAIFLAHVWWRRFRRASGQ